MIISVIGNETELLTGILVQRSETALLTTMAHSLPLGDVVKVDIGDEFLIAHVRDSRLHESGYRVGFEINGRLNKNLLDEAMQTS